MSAAVDTSFLFSLYLQDDHSQHASALMCTMSQPLPITPFLRHELRNAVRLAVFRGQITVEQRDQALADIDHDVRINVLEMVSLPEDPLWRIADVLGARHTEALGNRGMDILHVAAALTLGVSDFLTFDQRQRTLAQAVGLRVLP